ncbi:MAG: hypothetical protein AAF713_10315 [Pseudomonadota bacterium]
MLDSPAPDLTLLRPARMHEATGSGRRAFALAIAGRLTGPVLWVQDARAPDRLCPQGLQALLDPARVIMVHPLGGKALLQVMEDGLRSGAAPLVVGEVDAAPDLTQSRRLQLAAGTGGGRGLCLVPEGRLIANAAETRWHCTPIPGVAGQALQHWEMVKNKRGRLGSWEVALGGRAAQHLGTARTNAA